MKQSGWDQWFVCKKMKIIWEAEQAVLKWLEILQMCEQNMCPWDQIQQVFSFKMLQTVDFQTI
jgi:hypothetical protein